MAKQVDETSVAARYFASMRAALDGLDTYLADQNSPLYKHDLMAVVISEYLQRLENSFACWQNRLAFSSTFKVSRAESGFPVFQNVLELENDKRGANEKLAALPEAQQLREDMADFILRHKEFPTVLQANMAERVYLEEVQKGELFGPYTLPKTIKVSVNPKTMRPVYVVHWATFDGAANLPLAYSATIEDQSDDLIDMLVTRDGKLNEGVKIPLPVEGLLNPKLARQFDDFCEKNSAYSLTPLTIAMNMDKDIDPLQPKQLRRIVLGPFYTAGVTEQNEKVNDILAKVKKPENAWLLTWTVQDVFSKAEKPAKKGLWSSSPAREEYHIETDDLEATRQGVSAYEKHALIPHESYQALYASGAAKEVFAGYKVHIISNGQVVSDV
jgi:hypothetical protein